MATDYENMLKLSTYGDGSPAVLIVTLEGDVPIELCGELGRELHRLYVAEQKALTETAHAT